MHNDLKNVLNIIKNGSIMNELTFISKTFNTKISSYYKLITLTSFSDIIHQI
jgi:hypothetical protein